MVKKIVILLVLLVAAVLAAVWFFPMNVFRLVKPVLPAPAGDVDIGDIEGTPVHGYTLRDIVIDKSSYTLTIPKAVIGLDGLSLESIDVPLFHLNLKAGNALTPNGVHGRFSMANSSWTVVASTRNFTREDLHIGRIELTGGGESLSPLDTNGRLKLEGISKGPLTLKSVEAEVDGLMRDGGWTGVWNSFRIVSADTWSSPSPFRTDIDPPEIRISSFTLQNSGSAVRFDGKITNNRWNYFDLKFQDFDLANLNRYQLIKHPVAGWVSGGVHLKGALGTPDGTINLAVRRLALNETAIGRIDGVIQIEPKKIRLDQFHVVTSSGDLQVSGWIARKEGRPDIREFRVNVTAPDFNMTSLLNGLDVMKVQSATLRADLSVLRSRGGFSTEGALVLTADHPEIPQAGMSPRNLYLELRGEGDRLTVHKGVAFFEDRGHLVLTGGIDRKGPDLSLTAEEAAFSHPAGLEGLLDADLRITDSWEIPFVKGDIRIRSADFVPPEKKKEKEKGKEKGKKSPSPVRMDINLVFDRDVWFKKGPTSVEFKSNVAIRKDPYESVRLQGSLEVVRGAIVVYGRTFEIEKGVVLFSGNVPPNPRLNIQSVYESRETKFRVFLTVTGTRDHPEINLRSEPPLEQADIISVLATGRPLYELGEDGDAASSQAARNIVAGYVSEEIRQEVQDVIDLDVLRLQMKEKNVADLEVGKRLNEDLYVAYGRTLGPGGEQRVQAEYILTPIWNLEGTTTSTGRYVIDLLFKLGFE